MKYNNNLEIELDWEAVQCYSTIRYYYYRIKPNQLSLWDRLFHNSWKRLEKSFDDHWNPCFHPEDYWEYLHNMKTFKDLKNGDKIYLIRTDAPKLDIIELPIIQIECGKETYDGKKYDYIIIHVTKSKNKEEAYKIYQRDFNKEKTPIYYTYQLWHSSIEAARKTVKEIIEARIVKQKQIIKKSQKALENYETLLKQYQ